MWFFFSVEVSIPSIPSCENLSNIWKKWASLVDHPARQEVKCKPCCFVDQVENMEDRTANNQYRFWLVAYLRLRKILVSWDHYFPIYGKNKKCSKPQTRQISICVWRSSPSRKNMKLRLWTEHSQSWHTWSPNTVSCPTFNSIGKANIEGSNMMHLAILGFHISFERTNIAQILDMRWHSQTRIQTLQAFYCRKSI